MTVAKIKISPTKINLHQKSKLLEIGFSDGFEFNFPCEYLRVFSTAAEVRIAKLPIAGKAQVNINNIEPQGNYAIRLIFDDGHDSGIYSWETLHKLGKNYQQNWQDYNQQLTDASLQRDINSTQNNSNSDKKITILYFMQLANITGTASETIEITSSVKTVDDLLRYLREQKESWQDVFTADKVQVTVNKQFSEPYTPIDSGDEVAIVPRPD